MSDAVAPILGQDEGRIRFSSNEELKTLLWSMTRQTQRTLDFSTRHLEPALLDDAAYVEMVRQLVLRSSRTQIRLLVLDPAPLAARGHRLLELAYQLSSFISIRTPGQRHKDYDESTFIADRVGFIHRPLGDRPKGLADFNAPSHGAYFTQRFDEIWAYATPSAHLRKLVL